MCPHLHPRSMDHSWPRIHVPQGVEHKGMERDDRVCVCKASFDLFCNICSTVSVSGQLKVLDRSF